MSNKLIKIGDKYYRKRRGKLVEIPNRWLGQVSHPQTIRKRQSKFTKKIKRYMQACKKGLLPNYKDLKYQMLDDDK